jgi:hypothetical protein
MPLDTVLINSFLTYLSPCSTFPYHTPFFYHFTYISSITLMLIYQHRCWSNNAQLLPLPHPKFSHSYCLSAICNASTPVSHNEPTYVRYPVPVFYCQYHNLAFPTLSTTFLCCKYICCKMQQPHQFLTKFIMSLVCYLPCFNKPPYFSTPYLSSDPHIMS